jgi:1-deoxy-D-xylulose-5-phosphate reductoisomerase
MKEITILGSTGSIGQNTLEVVSRLPGQFRVVGLATRQNIELLKKQVDKFHPKWVAIADEEKGEDFKKNSKELLEEVFIGDEGVKKLAAKKVDLVVAAIVGSAGMLPTLEAIRNGNDIALSNKEVLVMAGKEVMEEAKKRKVRIFPLDSEHCAIFESIEGRKEDEIRKVILTASGGPFYDYDVDEFSSIKAKDALHHPVWKMGEKITIDSATLMNKGFEVIAARWLFNLDWDRIEVVIHPQAVIHSLVEFVDGITVAILAHPDMKIPIKYVLTYPKRMKSEFKPVDLDEISQLTFSKPNEEKFPALRLAYTAGKVGGTMPAVLNASNEVAVEAFLKDKITFPQIWQTTESVMDKHTSKLNHDWEDIWEADRWARKEASSIIEKL